MDPRNAELVAMERHPIVLCPETKYADEMIRTGFPMWGTIYCMNKKVVSTQKLNIYRIYYINDKTNKFQIKLYSILFRTEYKIDFK